MHVSVLKSGIPCFPSGVSKVLSGNPGSEKTAHCLGLFKGCVCALLMVIYLKAEVVPED